MLHLVDGSIQGKFEPDLMRVDQVVQVWVPDPLVGAVQAYTHLHIRGGHFYPKSKKLPKPHSVQTHSVHCTQGTGVHCTLYTGYKCTLYTVHRVQVYTVHCTYTIGTDIHKLEYSYRYTHT